MEILDIVDLNDNVVGYATKEDVYNKLLCHRVVYILIFNEQGEMALQLRSLKVLFCPRHWSTAVGGHVQCGETFKEAAEREYLEELGVRSKIEFFSKDLYQVPNRPDKIITTFKTQFNGPFKTDSAEVERIDFFNWDKIKEMIKNGEKFHPELLFLLNKYF